MGDVVKATAGCLSSKRVEAMCQRIFVNTILDGLYLIGIRKIKFTECPVAVLVIRPRRGTIP